MACKHGTPRPDECMWAGPPPVCDKCRIEELEAELADEVEENNIHRRLIVKHTDKIKRLREAIEAALREIASVDGTLKAWLILNKALEDKRMTEQCMECGEGEGKKHADPRPPKAVGRLCSECAVTAWAEVRDDAKKVIDRANEEIEGILNG